MVPNIRNLLVNPANLAQNKTNGRRSPASPKVAPSPHFLLCRQTFLLECGEAAGILRLSLHERMADDSISGISGSFADRYHFGNASDLSGPEADDF